MPVRLFCAKLNSNFFGNNAAPFILFSRAILASLLVFAVFNLTGCAAMSQPSRTQVLSWKEHYRQIFSISSWELQGKLAIHTKLRALSASLNWQQRRQNYALHFFGPLGINYFRLTGDSEKVILYPSNQPPRTASTPEKLLQQELGWQLPVSSLIYWIRGLPVPDKAAKTSWDAAHRLAKLYQENWQIEYLEYCHIKGKDLPFRIRLQHSDLVILMVIYQWQL